MFRGQLALCICVVLLDPILLSEICLQLMLTYEDVLWTGPSPKLGICTESWLYRFRNFHDGVTRAVYICLSTFIDFCCVAFTPHGRRPCVSSCTLPSLSAYLC